MFLEDFSKILGFHDSMKQKIIFRQVSRKKKQRANKNFISSTNLFETSKGDNRAPALQYSVQNPRKTECLDAMQSKKEWFYTYKLLIVE